MVSFITGIAILIKINDFTEIYSGLENIQNDLGIYLYSHVN
jgi:hypothetical protein